ncbi:MAG TPA: hypothetical protein VMF11_08955 [Candidatus Baltobacteraceae bacterium]|nr:hypothetical protein [Candidatus Baltobacteraceae bacterium]
MKRRTTYLALGFGTLLAGALLAACGGGGSSMPATAQAPGATQPGTTASQPGIKVQILVPRNVARSGKHSASRGKSRRMYVSTDAEGLQLTITPSGSGSAQTLYASLATSAPLCVETSNYNETNGGSEELCTIPVPALAAQETVTAVETDAAPTDVNATTGFGTGFASGSGNVLAVGSTTVTTTGGVNTVALGLGPVAAILYDCEGYVSPPSDPQNFGNDYSTERVVVTANTATTGVMSVEFADAAGGWYDALPTPYPGFSPVPQDFVDVNGSPEPITYAASTSSIQIGIEPAPSASPTSYASSGSIATDADYLYDCAFFFNVNVAALPTPSAGASPPTVVFANNLSATPPSPFTATPGPYTFSLTFSVVPIAAFPSTVSVAMGTTASVTGYDYGANTSYALEAESAYGMNDGDCYDTVNTSTVDATVAAAGSMNQTTGQQPFTITPENAGTCTFVLYDYATWVITNPVTVTVNS